MSPKNKKPTILAIDPGTRHMGIAVLDGDALIYHGVRTISRRLSPHERLKAGRAVVVRLIQDFGPTVLAVEKAFFAQNRNTALLNVFVDEIRAIARRKGLRLVALAPSTVKKAMTGSGKAPKNAVARAVVAKYPELGVYLGQNHKWKERYHGNMFDAVAVGLVAQREIRRRSA